MNYGHRLSVALFIMVWNTITIHKKGSLTLRTLNLRTCHLRTLILRTLSFADISFAHISFAHIEFAHICKLATVNISYAL